LKSAETSKPVGNIGLPVGITGKPEPKMVNHFFKKKSKFKKKLDSLAGLSKTGEIGPDRFHRFL
jgi:hypothetical protein